MKKLMLVLSFAVVMAGTLSSCCKTCTQTGQNSVSVCRNNYTNDTDYNNAIAIYTLGGYTCN